MESFFGTYYIDLQERIKSAVPSIRWIEQDYGQESNVDFPAVLVDFSDTSYDNITLGGTVANVEVTFRLLCSVFSQSYSPAPEEVKSDALQYLDIEHELIGALHGWQPNGNYVQPLMLSRATTSNRGDKGIRIRVLKFTTVYEEYVDDNREFKILPPKWQ